MKSSFDTTLEAGIREFEKKWEWELPTSGKLFLTMSKRDFRRFARSFAHQIRKAVEEERKGGD